MATPATLAARHVFRELHGVVVSSGLMDKTVKVRVGGKKYNPRVQQVRPPNILPLPPTYMIPPSGRDFAVAIQPNPATPWLKLPRVRTYVR